MLVEAGSALNRPAAAPNEVGSLIPVDEKVAEQAALGVPGLDDMPMIRRPIRAHQLLDAATDLRRLGHWSFSLLEI